MEKAQIIIVLIHALLVHGFVGGVETTSLMQNLRIGAITRQNHGDTFIAEGGECNQDVCIGLSSGTARLASEDEKLIQSSSSSSASASSKSTCTCQCHSHLPAFREDLQICVDDIHECVLAPFVSSSISQQIPFVFLPLKGQIIHPSKEISFAGIQTPVCAVSGAKFLTDTGWIDLRNPIDADVPFRLFRDEGRTFLQWIGESDLRNRMGGRLVLVHLLCREISTNDQEDSSNNKAIFTPCVAFRVVGTPIKYVNNVSEVVFAPDAHSIESGNHNGLSLIEYIAIGISSILLGLIYVASVFLYLHLRKRRKDSNSDHKSHTAQNLEEGVIKSNPLLNLSRHFVPDTNNYSDSAGSDTDTAPDIIQQQHDERKKALKSQIQLASVVVHPQIKYNSLFNIEPMPIVHQESIERLPEENVSIVETMEGREDRPDAVKVIGTVRRKLYFNPAYFEPQLLAAPPPAAVEFLTKIREVITIAKQKMAMKRYSPSLLGIPEEDSNYMIESHAKSIAASSRAGSMISLKRENSRRKTCGGCPGCEPQDFNALNGKLPEFPSLAACHNCSNNNTTNECKQLSIRKWLEDVPIAKTNTSRKIRSPTRSLSPQPMNKSEFYYTTRSLSPSKEAAAATSSNANTAKTIYEVEKRSLSPKTNIYDAKQHVKTNGELIETRSLSPKMRGEVKIKNYEEIETRSLSPKLTATDTPHVERIKVADDNETRSISSSHSGKNVRKIDAVKISKPKSPPPLPPMPPPPHNNGYKHPDMIKEALAVDNQTTTAAAAATTTTTSTTPTLIKTKSKMNAVINELSNLSKNSGDGVDETIYDYDVDSLERSKKGYRTPSEYADVSSQPSPSLSTALPMEEEMTMQNAIINAKTGNRTISKLNMDDVLLNDDHDYELIVLKKTLPELLQQHTDGYSLVSEVYVNNGYNYGSNPSTPSDSPCSTLERSPKIIYEENKPGHGHLLIEVADCADNYIKAEESDCYEPDTLDRKPKLKIFNQNNNKNMDDGYIDSLERPNRIMLRSKGSFVDKEEDLSLSSSKEPSSLREIYSNNKRIISSYSIENEDYEGRFLTLEERHSKRQRKLSNNIQPDLIPPSANAPIYEHPKPPRKVGNMKPPLPPKTSNNVSILKNFIHTDDIIFKNGLNNQIILQASIKHHHIPSSLQVKQHRKYRSKKLKVEDSGYLSTDSDDSHNVTKKRKCSGSETDESLGDGQSESGAESIETHSVFFGSFRKGSCMAGSIDSGVGSDLKPSPSSGGTLNASSSSSTSSD